MRAKKIAVLTLLLSFVAGCAQERSAQDKEREEEDRKIKRLKRAEGLYSGYATQNEKNLIPTKLNVKLYQKPGDDGGDKPELQVTLTLGLFGGVTLTSNSTSFDWKTGELNAGFTSAKASGEPTTTAGIELQAKIDHKNELQNAVIKGANSGDFTVRLSKADADALPEKLYRYYFTTAQDISLFLDSPSTEALGIVFIKHLENANTISPTSDLPKLPGLEASFRFFGLADAPEIAKNVIYDPLTGILEAHLNSGAAVTLTEMFAGHIGGDDSFALANPINPLGKIYFGSDPRIPFTLAAISKSDNMNDALLPPKAFAGTYAGVDGTVTWNMIAYLDPLGGTGDNTTGETAFSRFPKLRIRMITCLGNKPYEEHILDLFHVDHVNAFARFQRVRPSGVELLEIDYLKQWQTLEGIYTRRSSGSGGGTSRTATVKLMTAPGELREGCGYFGS